MKRVKVKHSIWKWNLKNFENKTRKLKVKRITEETNELENEDNSRLRWQPSKQSRELPKQTTNFHFIVIQLLLQFRSKSKLALIPLNVENISKPLVSWLIFRFAFGSVYLFSLSLSFAQWILCLVFCIERFFSLQWKMQIAGDRNGILLCAMTKFRLGKCFCVPIIMLRLVFGGQTQP